MSYYVCNMDVLLIPIDASCMEYVPTFRKNNFDRFRYIFHTWSTWDVFGDIWVFPLDLQLLI